MFWNAKLYYFYNTKIIQFIRFVVFSLLLFVLVQKLMYHIHPTLPLFFLSWFVMIEVFFTFKIAKSKPRKTVMDSSQENTYESYTLQALSVFVTNKKTSHAMQDLLHNFSIQFMLNKSDIISKEVPNADMPKEELARLAVDLVRNMDGRFVTTMDLFAVYILYIESQTKLLFSKHLKEKEFMHILQWTRFEYKNEENPVSSRVEFWGEGIGEDWVSGWTLETKKYVIDLTPQVLVERSMVIGREQEYSRVVEAIMRPEKSNALLVGDPGSGKTAIIHALAFESFLGKFGGNMYHKRFFELMIGTLLAGATNQGELENRLQVIIEEVLHAGNIILYIADLENILGASTFHLDLSGALLPYMRSGNLHVIATITPGNYNTFIETKPGLREVFEVIKLEEPSQDTAIQMLLEKAGSIEKKYGVSLTYRAIIAATQFAKRYMQGKVLPGSAVTLLSDAANSVVLARRNIVEETDIEAKIEETTHVSVASPVGQEKDLLLHFEEKMHEHIIAQDEAVKKIAEAMRRYRAGLAEQVRPISFLFLGPTGVGKTETAKALAALYFQGQEHMVRVDMSEYATEDGERRLLGILPGEQNQGSSSGELLQKVYEHQSSLVLLDEFEKAHPKILDLFLQMLDDGRLTSNTGKTVSFVNCIIIATSNAGSEFIREELQKGATVNQQFKTKLLDFLQAKGLFRPELLNRFDEIVVFSPLGKDQVIQITKQLLASVSQKLLEKDITVSFDTTVLAKIAAEGHDDTFGARPLRRYIQDTVEDLLSQKILKDEIKRGDTIVVATDPSNNFIITNA